MFETKKVTIRDVEFEFFAMNAEQGARWSYRIANVVAPTLAELIAGNKISELESDIGDTELNFDAAVKTLFEKLPEKTWMELCDVVLSNALAGGVKLKDGAWKSYFTGKPGLLIQVVAEGCKFQFSDFFGELVEKLRAAMSRIKTNRQSPLKEV